jgi:hypothetical protein
MLNIKSISAFIVTVLLFTLIMFGITYLLDHSGLSFTKEATTDFTIAEHLMYVGIIVFSAYFIFKLCTAIPALRRASSIWQGVGLMIIVEAIFAVSLMIGFAYLNEKDLVLLPLSVLVRFLPIVFMPAMDRAIIRKLSARY